MSTKTTIKVGSRELQILHDPLPTFGLPLPAEIVVGPGGASNTLLSLTPRREFDSAWDLGCGSGVQAAALATHCTRVLATDIDQRSIEFTQATALENGLAIETRLGSMFEPAAGETFDLVISNPPFVIGQITNLIHRESPLPADGLAELFLTNISNHLKPNGLAIVLLSWLETESESWEDRIANWLPSDTHAWVALRDSQDSAGYVETWLKDAGLADDSELRARWLSALDEWRATAIAFGWVVLQKTTENAEVSIEDVRAAATVPTGSEVEIRMQNLQHAAVLTALEILQGVFEQSELQAWRGSLSLPAWLNELRSRCNGQDSIDIILDKLVDDLAVDASDLMALTLTGVKELVSLGYLRLAPSN